MYLENILALPNVGIYIPAINKYFGESFLVRAKYGKKQIYYLKNETLQYTPTISPVKIIDNAYYGGWKIDHFGHFLLESLSRLTRIRHSPSKNIVWISRISDQMHFQPWQLEIFNLLGLSDYNHIVISDQTAIRALEIQETSYRIWDLFMEKHAHFLEVYKSPEIILGKKIWLSRKGIKGGWTNENEIENRLTLLGWQIFIPQIHSVTQQLQEICSAELVSGIEGAAFHTLILASDIQSKIVIFSRSETVNENYILIAKIKKFYQRIYYPKMVKVINNTLRKDSRKNSYIVDAEEVITTLLKY